MNPLIYIGLQPKNQAMIREVIKANKKRKVVNIPLEPTISDKQIIRKGISHFDVTEEELKGLSRLRRIVIARQIIMYTIRMKIEKLPLKKIGNLFNRDHSTVIYAIETVNDMCLTDKRFKQTVIEFLDTIH